MTSWAARMHRRAATFSTVVTSCGHPTAPYPRRLEKVKFGVPLEEVCKNDIPGPLLVLILKLNKEAPTRKDVFRAPGHQGAMKKLIHFLQTGRLVNMDNFSVYTIASVLKKFLRKLPGGIFGPDVELRLFDIIEIEDVTEQRRQINELITSLPVHTQRLLVLLFGTFRVIATNSERHATGMTSEALGVSVAPSFFQSCVSDGKTARMEDVLRFKVATKIMKHLIDEFSSADLFGRQNYEWYARVTGRILRVQGQWICSFTLPAELPHELFYSSKKLSLEPGKTWLQCQCDRWNMSAANYNIESLAQPDECQSMPTLIQTPTASSNQQTSGTSTGSLSMVPEHTLLESCTRLSVSLEENGLFKVTAASRSSSQSSRTSHSAPRMTLDELRAVNRYAESTKSLSYLPQVHERQTARMLTRSEWFLTPVSVECAGCGGSVDLSETNLNKAAVNACVAAAAAAAAAAVSSATDTRKNSTADANDQTLEQFKSAFRHSSSGNIVTSVVLSASAESVSQQKRPSLRRTNSRSGENGTKSRHLHRSNSRRNKENGASGGISSRSNSFRSKTETLQRSNSYKSDGNKSSNKCVCRSSSVCKRNKMVSGNASCANTIVTASALVDDGAKSCDARPEQMAVETSSDAAKDDDVNRDNSVMPMEVQTIHVTLTYRI